MVVDEGQKIIIFRIGLFFFFLKDKLCPVNMKVLGYQKVRAKIISKLDKAYLACIPWQIGPG